MLRACICDDELVECEKVRKSLEIYSFQNNIDIKTDIVLNPEAVIEHRKEYDVIFMDIRFGNESKGLDAGIELRRQGYRNFLVFITTYTKHAVPGYQAEAFRYILKPFTDKQIFEVMDAIFDRLNTSDDMLSVRTFEGNIIIELDNLIYAEGSDRHRKLIMVNGEHETSMKLKELYESLPKSRFAYPHKSYIVNFRYVSKVYKKVVYMTNEQRIPLGRIYSRDFMLALNQYIKQH